MFNRKQSTVYMVQRAWPLILAGAIVLVVVGWVLVYKPAIYSTESKYRFFIDSVVDMPLMGRIEAPITVIEFADPLCPGCKAFFETVEPELKRKYIDTGLVKFYHWPMIINKLGTSQDALEAMYCANDQNKYWEYRQNLFSIPRENGTWAEYERGDYVVFARNINLIMPEFTSCFDSKKHVFWIQEKDRQREAANINASATVLINDTLIELALLGNVENAIDRILIELNIQVNQ